MNSRSLTVLVVFLCPQIVLAAVTSKFDFEDVEIPLGQSLVEFTSPLSLTDNGVTTTISHENGASFYVNIRTGMRFVEQFGMQGMSMFSGTGPPQDPGAFVFDFDKPLTSAVVEMGDFGQDTDNLLLQAFDGIGATGNLLASDTGSLPGGGNNFGFETLSVTATNIRSLRMIGGSNSGNSVFYDNIVVTSIPEPSSAMLLTAVGTTFAALRRRR